MNYIDTIYKGWKEKEDWGISKVIKENNDYFAVVNKGVVTIGENGNNSSQNFMIQIKILKVLQFC